MIYLDNAATGGRKPSGVISAVRSCIMLNANPGRSGHKLSLAKAKQVLACRYALNDFFDGFGFERTVFTKNCTEALNIALFSSLKSGDHAVVTSMEHNSVLRPLEHLVKRGVSYDICPLEQGNVTVSGILKRINEKTKAVVVTSASNVTGAIPPIEQIGNALPKGVIFIVDGAQGGGHVDISMQKSKIDYLALAGHKGLFALQGSGALLFSDRVSPSPILYGGTGTTSNELSMPDFYPDCLEAGTLAYPSVLSLLEGLRFLTVRKEEVSQKTEKLTSLLIDGLQKIDGYTVYSKPNPCGIVAFSHRKIPSEDVAFLLSEEYSIAVRAGLHCAPKMHEALGTLESGLVRASFSYFNSPDEVKFLLRALEKIAKGI